MTEDDERMIKGQVVEDLANAKQKLQCLMSQRDSMMKVLHAAIAILSGERKISNPVENVDFPTAPEIAAIVSDIKDVESKIAGLERRMKEFGL